MSKRINNPALDYQTTKDASVEKQKQNNNKCQTNFNNNHDECNLVKSRRPLILITIVCVSTILCLYGMYLHKKYSSSSDKHENSISFYENISISLTSKAASMEFLQAFVESFTVILVSELGDKTFFIAAIMAMRYSRLIVFSGAAIALSLMTVISVGFGMAVTLIPRIYTYYISTILLAMFGIKMLKDGYYMSAADTQKEFEEVEQVLKSKDKFKVKSSIDSKNPKIESKITRTSTAIDYIPSDILMQAFSMTLLAEWGDRSQLTTIVLTAREDAFGVIVGGIVGHAVCTGLAVVGGRMIAQRISVRTVTFVGGILFLIFAFGALFLNTNEEIEVMTS